MAIGVTTLAMGEERKPRNEEPHTKVWNYFEGVFYQGLAILAIVWEEKVYPKLTDLLARLKRHRTRMMEKLNATIEEIRERRGGKR